jgi:hypothetical protein
MRISRIRHPQLMQTVSQNAGGKTIFAKTAYVFGAWAKLKKLYAKLIA